MSSCSALSLPSGMAALHDRASLLAGAFLPLLHVAKTHKALVRFSIKGSSNRKGCNDMQAIEEKHPYEFQPNNLNKVQTEVCQGQHTLIWEQLRTFPSEELTGKVVLVRCNLDVSFEKEHIIDEEPIVSAAPTIAYLQQLGARTVLASHWQPIKSPVENLDAQLIAACLSKHIKKEVLQAGGVIGDSVRKIIDKLENGSILLLGNLLLHKEEVANDKDFSRKLAEGIDILVNDSFSIAHRVLASTVGITRFTSARIAGFQLEKELFFLTMAIERCESPLIAVVGGAKVSKVLGVLYSLVNKGFSVIITGSMVYTFLYALGTQGLPDFVESTMIPAVLNLMEVAKEREVEIFLPSDFLCIRGSCSQVFKAGVVPDGWTPICFGQQSLETTNAALQVCKMALWIGPVSMGGPLAPPEMAMLFATIFGKISQRGCITIVGGKEACSAVKNVGVASLITHLSGGGSAFLNLLKGMTLPGVAALDLACPMVLDWGEIYGNPYLPLFIDIGSGNGVFNLQMAQKYQDPQNYLGLEINRKLVKRCLDSVVTLQLRNVHFVTADATTALQRIVHNYPGQVTSVAVQCPDPNFSDPDSRWRVVQRRLVEAVVDILCKDGKVFLQSDVKDVAIQMKSEFLKYSGKNLVLSIEHLDPQKCDTEGWLNDNPFDISTDWENHVLERGDQMYRILLSRLGS
eukprot:c25759_g1_i2 orf=321-2381(-)